MNNQETITWNSFVNNPPTRSADYLVTLDKQYASKRGLPDVITAMYDCSKAGFVYSPNGDILEILKVVSWANTPCGYFPKPKIHDYYLSKAKRIGSDEWVIGYYVHEYDSDMIYTLELDDSGFHYIHIDPTTLSSCTGKRDIHGILLFENQVVKGRIYDEEKDNEVMAFGTIKYSPELSAYYISRPCGNLSFDDFVCGKVELVGNVFDNSDVLNQNKYEH